MITKKVMLLLYAGMLCKLLSAQGTLNISPGTTFRYAGGVHIVVDNMNFANQGNVSFNPGAGGGLLFTGNTSNSIVSNTPLSLDNLSILKQPGTVVNLQSDLNISGVLYFDQGRLNLGNHKIDLGSTGMIYNESETGHAYTTAAGYIQANGTIPENVSTNLGGLGATLTSSTNLGNTTIRRGHRNMTNMVGSGTSILRNYEITPTAKTGLDVTFQFNYLDAELNGLEESTLAFLKSEDGTSWTNAGSNSRNTTTNYVEKDGINNFSIWTLSSPGNPLPIRFALVNTHCNGSKVFLQWQAAGDQATTRFDIERTQNGSDWRKVGSVPYNGANGRLENFYFNDDFTSKCQYRIAAVSTNGQKSYSTIVKSSCEQKEIFSVWPNPVVNELNIMVKAATVTKTKLLLYDAKGALMHTEMLTVYPGFNQLSLNTAFLPKGTYHVHVQWEKQSKTTQFIKQ